VRNFFLRRHGNLVDGTFMHGSIQFFPWAGHINSVFYAFIREVMFVPIAIYKEIQ
jgi:hypothetical protein